MLTDIDPQIAHEIQYAAVGTQPAAALGAPATWDQAWRSLDGVMLGCRGRWVVVGDTAHDVDFIRLFIRGRSASSCLRRLPTVPKS